MSHSVIAIVKGGLGNQLFIYAAARALALRTGRELLLDIHSGFANDSYARSYRLNLFGIQATVLPAADLPWRSLKDWRHKSLRACNKLLPATWRNYLAERDMADVDQLTSFRPRRAQVILNGYWQDEGYFKDHAAIIRRELEPAVPKIQAHRQLGEEMRAAQSVFLHIRRVRYSPRLNADYYQAAISEICLRLHTPKFYLFGDDLDWPQANLDFQGHEVCVMQTPPEDEVADLWLMTCCRHGIIANSSFSWWAAWLGGNDATRMMFAPARTGLRLTSAPYWRLISAGVEIPPDLKCKPDPTRQRS